MGFGLKLVQDPSSNIILPLWPTYYVPTNHHCTLSPTALRHYLKLPSVVTNHLQNLTITTNFNQTISIPSIPSYIRGKLLDYHKLLVIRPKPNLSCLPTPTVNRSSTYNLSRELIHQRLGHSSHRKLDLMCQNGSLQGLPKRPFPQANKVCPICVKAKFSHPPKGHTVDTTHLRRGELLHIDFAFWDITSLRGFTSMLSIIDAKTRMLWLFCTASKGSPIHIIEYLLDMLHKENCSPMTIRVDEEGSLARCADFTKFLIHRRLTLETTGGHSSFLNGKIERPHRTISQLVRAMILNAGQIPSTWCYCAETAADIYRYTYHHALQTTPYEAWYGAPPHISDLRVWGCVVYVKQPDLKKSQDRVIKGFFMGFTKSRLLIRWLDPTTNSVKHAYAVKFDEFNTPSSPTDMVSPGRLLLQSSDTSSITLPECSIDTQSTPLLGHPIFSIQLSLPPIGQSIGCTITTCSYNNLPYIESFHRGTSLAQSLLANGSYNSTFWILSINNTEFTTASSVVSHLHQLQEPSKTVFLPCFLAKRIAPTRSSLAENRAMFNQIRLTYNQEPPSNTSLPIPTVVPVGMKVLSLPTRPDAPSHFGQLSHNPLQNDWMEALFDNYDKMARTGTWSAPMLRSLLPPSQQILRPRVSFRVKDTDITDTYELQGRTCADGSKQQQYIDFNESYAPVGSIDSIRTIICYAAANSLTINVMDISNAFQSSIVFDPSERVYLSLPPKFLDWFTSKWPDFPLPNNNPTNFVIQCLKSIQGTKDAGLRWYRLLTGTFRELDIKRSTIDHGIFVWLWQHETCYIALETDDILVASPTNAPFLFLKQELEKIFDLTMRMGSMLRYLNIRIIQSPAGISIDQSQHIKTHLLDPYFKDIPPSSIPKKRYPFPIETSFEQLLFEAPPLTGTDLLQKEKAFRFSFRHLVGSLLHITTLSRPDLCYTTMRLSGYMATPNAPIFDALHQTLCYLYHHPHLPIMYPSKPMKHGGDCLSTFWGRGQGEYLSSEYGDDLATYSDADHARCLRTRRSVSAFFILYNGVLVSWSCKKQLRTALHSTGSELTALWRGAFKTRLLRDFLQSIGIHLSTPSPTFEDNQGTINLIRSQRLTDTVRHHAVKIAWLNEQFEHRHLKPSYTKTNLMLCDCITKPSNGAKLFEQISYAIGQRYYPTIDSQHYHDLELHLYSYLSRQSKHTKPP